MSEIPQTRVSIRYLTVHEFEALFRSRYPKGSFTCAVCLETGFKQNVRAINERTDEVICDRRNCLTLYSQGKVLG